VLKRNPQELDYSELMVETQMPSDRCRPDIDLWKDGEIRVFIEAKVEKKVTWGQIRKQSADLKASVSPQKGDHSPFSALVLLTKVRADPPMKMKLVNHFISIRWRKVAEIVRAELMRPDVDHKDPVSEYIAEQFIGFLREEGLAIEKVEKAVLKKESISSFTNLMMMIEESVKITTKQYKHCSEDGSNGFYFKRFKYWCGISHDKLDHIVFQVHEPRDVVKARVVECRPEHGVDTCCGR
jgi:hypothetical protein